MKKRKVIGAKDYFEMKNDSLDQPLTLRRFIRFYEDRIEPRFLAIEKGFAKSEHENKNRFDFLHKSYEDLRQEYLIICHQFKRAEKKIEAVEARNGEVDSKYYYGEKYLEDPTQELADVKFRLAAAERWFKKLAVRLAQLE